MKNVMKAIVTTATMKVRTPLRHRDRRAGEAEQPLGAAVALDRLADPSLELVALGEAAERAPALGDVVDVAGQRVGEPARLVDERRDEQRIRTRRSRRVRAGP